MPFGILTLTVFGVDIIPVPPQCEQYEPPLHSWHFSISVNVTDIGFPSNNSFAVTFNVFVISRFSEGSDFAVLLDDAL